MSSRRPCCRFQARALALSRPQAAGTGSCSSRSAKRCWGVDRERVDKAEEDILAENTADDRMVAASPDAAMARRLMAAALAEQEKLGDDRPAPKVSA
jgi:hypothetical protein